MEGWIALGSLFVAALTLLLGYLRDSEARSAAYRTRLYDKQFDAITDLLTPLRAHYKDLEPRLSLTIMFATLANGTLTQEEWADIYAGASRTRSDLLAVWDKNTIVLPKQTTAAIERYDKVAQSLRDYPNASEALSALEDAFRNTLQQMRRDLGTDPLTDANLRAMGVLSQERQDAMIESYKAADRRLSDDRRGSANPVPKD